jgi:hypothetical protein
MGPHDAVHEGQISRLQSNSENEPAYHSVTPFSVTIRDICYLVVPVDEWEFLPIILGFVCKMFAGRRGQAVHCVMDRSQSGLFDTGGEGTWILVGTC